MASSAPLTRRELLRRSALTAGGLAAGSVFGGALPAFGAAAPIGVTADNLSFARVWPRTLRQAQALASFDDTHALHADGSMEFLLWPGDRAKLDSLGVEYRIFTPHTGGAIPGAGRPSGLALQPGERTAYRVLSQYVTDMQALATKYPANARMIKFPEKSLEGRDVYGIEIANDIAAAQTDGRPTFWVDGVHHSREWPSSEYSIMFAYDLLENLGKEARITELLGKLRVIIVPVMNPDGFHRSRSAPTDTDGPADQTTRAAYWRKNTRSLTGAFYSLGQTESQLNVDAHGTDPNRNYPFFWGGEGGGTDPTSATYGGSAPFAEPESRNIAGAMKSMQVTAYLTNHTSGMLCMRPWGYTNLPSPDDAFQRTLGAEMCTYHKYKNQIGLSLYPTSGTSRDWSYAALRTIVYTFEHNLEFHPAYGENIPGTYAKNRTPWLILAEAAADPRNHVVLTGKVVDASGAPVAGQSITLTKSFKTPIATDVDAKNADSGVAETITSSTPSRADGTFEIHANPSTRPHLVMWGKPAEAWTVKVGGTTLEVIGDRGDRKDLGTITI
jgi:hypothetical protein